MSLRAFLLSMNSAWSAIKLMIYFNDMAFVGEWSEAEGRYRGAIDGGYGSIYRGGEMHRGAVVHEIHGSIFLEGG